MSTNREMKKTINKEPLYFVDYWVHYDGDDEHYKEKFSTVNVRKLNITQDELTHILNVIQSWSILEIVMEHWF